MTEKSYYSDAYFKKSEELFTQEDRFKKVLCLLNKYKKDNTILLDLGCGNGSIAAFVKERMHLTEVYGAEISAEGTEFANQKGVKAFQVDIGQSVLPFTDGFFDIVFCGEVIEHIFNTDFVMNEAYRVLNKNGILIITTPNIGAWYNRAALLFGFQPSMSVSPENPELGKPFSNSFKKQSSGGSESHIRFFTKRGLTGLLKIHNFKILTTQGSYYTSPNSGRFVEKMMYTFDKFFAHSSSLGTDLVISARKTVVPKHQAMI